MADQWRQDNPQLAQILDAKNRLTEAKATAIEPPFKNLFHLTKHLTSPSIWFFVAFSGHGKTTLAMALAEAWGAQNIPVWFLGLESEPDELRLKRAAKACQIHPGLAMSGQLTDAEHMAIQDHLTLQAEHVAHGGYLANVTFSPTRALTSMDLTENAAEAYERGAKVFIIDHIDHVSAEQGGGGYQDSRLVCEALLNCSKTFPMVYLAMSQANMESLSGGDRLGTHKPVQPNHVLMKTVKRNIANGMIGVYRPLQDPPNDPAGQDRYLKDLKAIRAGALDPWTLVAKNTMALNCMKNRDYGEMEGQKSKLHVDKGNVRDWYESDSVQERIGGSSFLSTGRDG